MPSQGGDDKAEARASSPLIRSSTCVMCSNRVEHEWKLGSRDGDNSLNSRPFLCLFLLPVSVPFLFVLKVEFKVQRGLIEKASGASPALWDLQQSVSGCG